MLYSSDSETADAVEAAQRHHVLTREVLEESKDPGQWVIESFLADGKTALHDGEYGIIS